jgi:hypothetical protein
VVSKSLPQPTKGPYSLDLDDLFAQASAAVRARGDIVAQLGALEGPPDLEARFVDQRAVLVAGVRDMFNRCVARANRLHQMLAFRLLTLDSAKPYQLAEDIVFGDSGQVVARLASAVPLAQEDLEFRTLVTEWEAQRRDIIQSLEKAMLSVALAELNTSLTEEAAPRMKVTSFDGLRESVTAERIVVTESYEQLEGMLRDRNEGSFGIAGPRGVGKSTLVNFFATTSGVSIDDTVRDGEIFSEDEMRDLAALGRPRLGVVVSAPVAYEPREFLLHLHAEMCRRILGDTGEQQQRRRDQLPATHDEGEWLRRAASWLVVLGSCALAGGFALLTLAFRHRLPWTWQVPADIGAAILGAVGVALILLALVTDVLWLRMDREVRLSFEYRPGWRAGVLAAVAVLGLTLLLDGGGWAGGTWLLLTGEALVIVSVPLLRLYKRAHTLAMWAPAKPRLALDDNLRELAFDHLRQIRYQQSFSHERSVAVKFGGKLPVGLDVGGKRGTTMEERPKGFPELVSDLRDFLTTVAERRTVIIGVDELDKLRSAGDVEKFLNDIKGIFGTPGCYFLVSVSEDAAASFERRGIPFRDVFDSAFDDVISVQRLDLAAARKVLYGFFLGWTKPFVGLCYVLSGGLARDLRRTARELITYRDAGSEIALGPVTIRMCRREGSARLRAIRHELMRDPFDPNNVELLAKIADLTPDTATADDMRTWHRELSKEASESPASRLGLELAAYLLYAATVIEFFDPTHIATRVIQAESPGPKSLDTLAAARQSLAVSPGMSLAYTQRFRAAWGLAAN